MVDVGRNDQRRRRHAAVALVGAAVAVACSAEPAIPLDDGSPEATAAERATPSNDGLPDAAAAGSSLAGSAADDELPEVGDAAIRVRTDRPLATIEPHVLGTNVAVWILPEVLGDDRFHDVTRALGTSLLRFPGGSWSNDYEWAGCEIVDVDQDSCAVPWASRASDLLDLMAGTELPAMWTVAFNRTAEETAAAVAFFNGSVDDDRPIGVDRDGRDWGTVATWAQLRAERGYPDSVRIRYWEIGNEIYGAVAGAGDGCAPWGWENTWTCSPADYIEGDADHDGFLDFREAILEVDPTVEVGAIGIGARGEWSDWDDIVMGLAGDAIDFYAVHHYGSNGDLSAPELLEIPEQAWPRISGEVRSSAADNNLSPDLRLTVTEHNMVAFLDGDEERLMTSAANAFYLADTIGQFVANGVSITNQWLLVNGPLENGTNYALIDPDGMQRLPAYYGMAMWARAGRELVATEQGPELDELSVYSLLDADGQPRAIVMNPTSDPVTASMSATGAAPTRVTADVLAAESLEAQITTFNGSTDPSLDLTEPAPEEVAATDGSFDYEFAPFSITLLRWWPSD